MATRSLLASSNCLNNCLKSDSLLFFLFINTILALCVRRRNNDGKSNLKQFFWLNNLYFSLYAFFSSFCIFWFFFFSTGLVFTLLLSKSALRRHCNFVLYTNCSLLLFICWCSQHWCDITSAYWVPIPCCDVC